MGEVIELAPKGPFSHLRALARSLDASFLLDEPLLAFVLECGLVGRASSLLDEAVRRRPSATFGELLDAGSSAGRAELAPCAAYAWRKPTGDALDTFVRRFTSPQRSSVRATLEPPPRSGDLLGWASRLKVEGLVRSKARKVLRPWLDWRVSSSLGNADLLELMSVPPPGKPELQLAQAAAWSWLRATTLVLLVPFVPGHPADPVLASIVGALESTLQRRQVRLDSKVPPFRHSFQAEESRLKFCFKGEGWYSSWVDLARWKEGAVSAGCECYGSWRRRCTHETDALLAAWQMLLDPLQAAAAEQMVATLARPWLVRLDRLDRALSTLAKRQTAKPADGLVSFRLIAEPFAPRLEAQVHKPLKRGGWSEGRRITAEQLRSRGFNSFPNAGQVVAALGRASGYGSDRSATFDALNLLAGYPHLFLADAGGAPLTVAHGTFGLRLQREKNRLALVRTIDGDPDLGASLAREGGRRHILIDREHVRCVLVELTEAQEGILRALGLGTEFPPEALDDLMPRLAALEHLAPLELPPDLEGEPVQADDRLVLRLTPAEGTLSVEVLARPLAEAAAVPPGSPPPRLVGFREGKRVHVSRDLAREDAAAKERLATLPLPAPESEAGPGRWRYSVQGDAALDLLAAVERAGDVVAEWPKDAAKVSVRGRAEVRSLRVEVQDRHDWFGLSGEVAIDEERISLALLLDAVRRGSRYAQISPGRWVEIAADLRSRLEKAADVVFTSRSGLEVSPAAAETLADLLDSSGELAVCARWSGLVSKMKAAQALDPEVPKELKATLRPYQADGFRWLVRMAGWGVGGCLADDMGLGKTVQALAALMLRASEGPALVVAPTSVCFNWVRECERFAPTLRPRLFREGDRKATLTSLKAGELLITTYALLVLHAEDLKAVKFSTLVLDEAQAVKNPATRRARAARDLDAAWRIALTGTPVENHLGELWSLFCILSPGLLGSWEQFRERFAGPIERQKDEKRRAALARVVRPFVLRRTKDKVAPELPPRTELTRLVTLSAPERRVYDDARIAAVAQLGSGVGDGEDKRFQVLAAITRLRQLACHPRLLDADSKLPSSKLKELMELVDELREEGHRALVFSQFTSHLALVREALDAAKVTYLYLDGATPEAERVKRVDAFQRGEAELFLISLKAGGTGLNLTAADYVIHLDPWWNPAVEDQATDRAHRIGQDKPVTVYRLVSKGTIEEAILSLHDEKRDLVAGVLDGAASAARLSSEELLGLIRAGEEAPDVEVADHGDEEVEERTEAKPAATQETQSVTPSPRPRGRASRRGPPQPPPRPPPEAAEPDEPHPAGDAPVPARSPGDGLRGRELIDQIRAGFRAHVENKRTHGTAGVYGGAVDRFLDWLAKKDEATLDLVDTGRLIQRAELYLFELGQSSPHGRVFRSALHALKVFVRQV